MVTVFKTSVTDPAEALLLKPLLNSLPCQWNFDLADRDKILRVITHDPAVVRKVSAILAYSGFQCEELTD